MTRSAITPSNLGSTRSSAARPATANHDVRSEAAPPRRIRRLLVANRGEIAVRIMRAAAELGIHTIAVYSQEDRLARHRFVADESHQVGAGRGAIDAYLDVDDLMRIAISANAGAVHPGYGFLAEKPELARACEAHGLVFVGPSAEVLVTLGDKSKARAVAQRAGVPVLPATGVLPEPLDACVQLAEELGYPVIVKAAWGGGGRGMRVVSQRSELADAVRSARREAASAFGNGAIYLEKLVQRARHVEVQIVGDQHGTLVHLFERDCTLQRRHQKVIERAPAPFLTTERRDELCQLALRLGRAAGYTLAGTVEFLMDIDSGAFYFIEVNPRIQVEHTITEEVTGLDLVKAQLRLAEGARIGAPASFVPRQDEIRLRGHAIQCRVTTEDPTRGFAPSEGRIEAVTLPAGAGVRLDEADLRAGAQVTSHYDSLLLKLIARGETPDEAISRARRALAELRIAGVRTNVAFLGGLLAQPMFAAASYTTRTIESTPELSGAALERDALSPLLAFLAEVTVNVHPDLRGRAATRPLAAVHGAPAIPTGAAKPGSRDRLRALGADAFARSLREERRVLLTDTTFRDAHQSLLATRLRTLDMLAIAPFYARRLAELFSIECWGGATFDASMRYLREDPWERLRLLRRAIPNVLFQMLLRASNAVGYATYPANVVEHFVAQAAKEGVDLFRVFDSFNSVERMRVAIDAVREAGALCEGTICYTSDLFDSGRPKYGLAYYVSIARALERAGAHILGIKDMAGLCRPRAARELVTTLRREVGLPVHFHTHDTSGAAAASVLAAVEAGCDAVDAAVDSMSGLTSQPSLGAIIAALAGSERDPGVDLLAVQEVSRYFEQVRRYYAPFESDMRAGTSEVYRHEMPGGQYTNLREQARGLGLEGRFDEVATAYAEVNRMFGDIVKVTPASKVVGDMALCMVAKGLTPADVLAADREVAFPESVVSLFRGDLGVPEDGFPEALARKVLRGSASPQPIPDVDLDSERTRAAEETGEAIDEARLASFLMYPKLAVELAAHRKRFGDVWRIPTPAFFHGLREGEEVSIELGSRTAHIALEARSEPNQEGRVRLFLMCDGAARTLDVVKEDVKEDVAAAKAARARANPSDPRQLGAAVAGRVAKLVANEGADVERGGILLHLEAMKMELAVYAERAVRVARVVVREGEAVKPGDLLMEFA